MFALQRRPRPRCTRGRRLVRWWCSSWLCNFPRRDPVLSFERQESLVGFVVGQEFATTVDTARLSDEIFRHGAVEHCYAGVGERSPLAKLRVTRQHSRSRHCPLAFIRKRIPFLA